MVARGIPTVNDQIVKLKGKKSVNTWVSVGLILVGVVTIPVYIGIAILPVAIGFAFMFYKDNEKIDQQLAYLEAALYQEEAAEKQRRLEADPEYQRKRREAHWADALRTREEYDAWHRKQKQEKRKEESQRKEQSGRLTQERVEQEMRRKGEPPLMIMLGEGSGARYVEMWMPKEDLEETFGEEKASKLVEVDGKLYWPDQLPPESTLS